MQPSSSHYYIEALVAFSGLYARAGRRGNQQYLADRLDPIGLGLAIIVDGKKYVEALRRISA